jgi:hypothetical protein
MTRCARARSDRSLDLQPRVQSDVGDRSRDDREIRLRYGVERLCAFAKAGTVYWPGKRSSERLEWSYSSGSFP